MNCFLYVGLYGRKPKNDNRRIKLKVATPVTTAAQMRDVVRPER